MKIHRSKIFGWGWTIAVTIALLLPGREFPKLTWLSRLHFDKWVHFVMFLGLVLLWCRVLLFSKLSLGKKDILGVLIIWVIYGIVVEGVQHYFIPYRSFDAWDIAADLAGAIAGALVSLRYIKK